MRFWREGADDSPSMSVNDVMVMDMAASYMASPSLICTTLWGDRLSDSSTRLRLHAEIRMNMLSTPTPADRSVGKHHEMDASLRAKGICHKAACVPHQRHVHDMYSPLATGYLYTRPTGSSDSKRHCGKMISVSLIKN